MFTKQDKISQTIWVMSLSGIESIFSGRQTCSKNLRYSDFNYSKYVNDEIIQGVVFILSLNKSYSKHCGLHLSRHLTRAAAFRDTNKRHTLLIEARRKTDSSWQYLSALVFVETSVGFSDILTEVFVMFFSSFKQMFGYHEDRAVPIFTQVLSNCLHFHHSII